MADVVLSVRAGTADELDGLLARVGDVAEIPRAVGGEVTVTRR